MVCIERTLILFKICSFFKVKIVCHSSVPGWSWSSKMKQIIKWTLDPGVRKHKLIKPGNIGVKHTGKRHCHKGRPTGTPLLLLVLILIWSGPASKLLASPGDSKPGTCASQLSDPWPSRITNTGAAHPGGGGDDTGFYLTNRFWCASKTPDKRLRMTFFSCL